MGTSAKNAPAHCTWRILLGICCIGLLLLGATLQVAHTHAAGPSAHTDCSLCLSAHLSIEVAANQDLVITRIIWKAPPVLVQPDLKFRFVAFSLFIRPPPALFVVA